MRGCLTRERTVRKTCYNQRLEYLKLDCRLKKTDFAKDQYKLFKDQMNVINNNIEDDAKAEDGAKTENGVKKKHDEIIDIMKYFYIGGEYKNVISKLFKFGLLDRDLYLTNFDNQQLGLTKAVNKLILRNPLETW